MNTTFSAITEAIGWTLLHSIWQATAIAFLLLIFTKFAHRARPSRHYAAGCVALCAILASSVATFAVHFDPVESQQAAVESSSTAVVAAEPSAAPIPITPKEVVATPSEVGTEPTLQVAQTREAEVDRPWLPWIVAVWAIGVCLLSLRFLLSWSSVLSLRRSGEVVADSALLSRFDAIAKRLRISRPVQILVSTQAKVPMVIGCLKPVVLLPAGLLSGLDARQLEAIIAHELAHIRRHDYLINLVQNLVETVFFFHPAVWWTSVQVRRDRENCCDDVAAELSGGALQYGRALAALEALLGSGSSHAFGPAANGGNLLSRIRRLAGTQEPQRSIMPAALVSLSIVVIAVFASVVVLAQPAEGTAAPATAGEDVNEEKGGPTPPKVEKMDLLLQPESLSWGKRNTAGLAAAIFLDPAKESYPAGAEISRSYLIGNFGKEVVDIEIAHHVQDPHVDFAVTGAGENTLYSFGNIIDDGAVGLVDISLRPGEFVSIPSSRIFTKKMPAGEGESPAGTFLLEPERKTIIVEGDTETEIAFNELRNQEYQLSATIDLGSGRKLATGRTKFVIADSDTGNESVRSGGIIQRVATEEKVMALALEDGPHATNTPRILDFLKERGVKATFYLVGLSVERYPEIVKRMVDEGHEVGNHTMKHGNLKKMEDAEILKELRDCHQAIVDACGVAPKTCRAPYGALTDEQCALIEKELGYKVVGWSIDPEDWKRPGVDVVANRLIEQAHPGGITIVHDIHAPTVMAVKKAVDGLLEKGYKFATVSQLIRVGGGEPKEPEPKPLKVKGTVLDAETGKPITKFTIQAGKIGPEKTTWGYSQSGQSSKEGRFSTTLRLHEGWTGRILADGYEPMPILAMKPPKGKESIEVTLRLTRGRVIRGTVLDHEGKPLAGAGVFRIGPTGLRLKAGNALKSYGDGEIDDSANPAITDAKGRFELRAGGVDRIAVSDVTLDAWPFAIPEDPDEKIVIRLPEAATMTIEFDIDGAVEEDEIFFQTLRFREELWRGLEVTAQQPIKNGGTITMKGLVPGPYQFARNKSIRLGGMGIGAFIGRTFVDLRPGESQTLKFVRPKGARLVGEVDLPDGVKLYGTLIKVKSAKKMIDPTDGKERDVEVAGVALKEDGTYETERIAPGKYIVTAEAYAEPDEKDRFRSGRMGPNFTAQAEIDVPAGGGPVRVGKMKLKPR